MQEADTDAGAVGFRGGEALVVLELPRQARQWNVAEERGRLGRNPVLGDNVVRERCVGYAIVDGYRCAFLVGKAGQVTRALIGSRHAAVLADWCGGPLSRHVEEDHVFGIVLDHMGNVGSAHEGETERVLCIAGLRLRLGSYREWGCIQPAVSPSPVEGAVGLIGLEVAEIAEAAATSATSTAATSKASASEAPTSTAKTAPTPTGSSATRSALSPASPLSALATLTALATRATAERLVKFRVL